MVVQHLRERRGHSPAGFLRVVLDPPDEHAVTRRVEGMGPLPRRVGGMRLPVAKQCFRGIGNAEFPVNYYNKDDANCWIVNHRVYTTKVLRVDFYNRMKAYLREHGATSTVVGNRYWRNDSSDYLLVAHSADPAAYGFPPEQGKRWTESQWHASAATDGTPRRGFIDAMKAFGEKYREAVRKGFRNRLGAGASGLKFKFAQ